MSVKKWMGINGHNILNNEYNVNYFYNMHKFFDDTLQIKYDDNQFDKGFNELIKDISGKIQNESSELSVKDILKYFYDVIERNIDTLTVNDFVAFWCIFVNLNISYDNNSCSLSNNITGNEKKIIKYAINELNKKTAQKGGGLYELNITAGEYIKNLIETENKCIDDRVAFGNILLQLFRDFNNDVDCKHSDSTPFKHVDKCFLQKYNLFDKDGKEVNLNKSKYIGDRYKKYSYEIRMMIYLNNVIDFVNTNKYFPYKQPKEQSTQSSVGHYTKLNERIQRTNNMMCSSSDIFVNALSQNKRL